jgi:hypothetical protein
MRKGYLEMPLTSLQRGQVLSLEAFIFCAFVMFNPVQADISNIDDYGNSTRSYF